MRALSVRVGTIGRRARVAQVAVVLTALTALSAGSVVAVTAGPAVAADSTSWLDQGYGTGGTLTLPSVSTQVPTQRWTTTATATLADGRQVVAGAVVSTSSATGPCGSWVLARLLPDGTPDPTFGSGGTRTLPPSACSPNGANLPVALAVQSTGAVVVGGSQGTYLRVGADGTVDTAFGTRTLPSGTCNAGRTRLNAAVSAISVDAADNILLTGSSVVTVTSGGCPLGPGSPSQIAPRAAVLLLGPTGTALPDPAPRPWPATASSAAGAWSAGGTLVVSVGSFLYWWGPAAPSGTPRVGGSVAVDASGRIATLVDPGTGVQLQVLRDGAPDPTFAAGQPVSLPPAQDPGSGLAQGTRVVWTASGGPAVVATPAPGRLVAARWTSDGTPDAGFGTGGVVTITVQRNGFLQKLDPRPVGAADGSLVVGLSAGRSVVLAADGTAGSVRGGDDFTVPVTCGTGCTANRPTAFVLGQPDGSALLRTADGRLARLLPDGSALDPAFGTGGFVSSPVPGVRITTAQRLAGGGLLVQGDSSGDSGTFLARYDDAGRLDPGFATAGVLVVEPASFEAGQLGRILVRTDTDLWRYTAQGALDTGFGTSGRVPLVASAAVDVAGGVLARTGPTDLVRVDDAGTVTPIAGDVEALVADGLGGTLAVSAGTLRRYRADGTLDPAYGSAGTAVLPPGVAAGGLFPSGVTSGGVTTGALDAAGLRLLRLTAAGAPDASWANAGVLRLTRPGGLGIDALWVGADGSATVVFQTLLLRIVPAPTPDVTPPAIAVTTPADGALYLTGNGTVFADYACSDDRSGVGSCVGTLPTGSALPFTLGPSTFTVDATDPFGNTASRVAGYTVRDGLFLTGFNGSSNFGVSDTRPIGWDLSNVTSTGTLLMVEEPVNAATPGATTVAMQLRTQFPAATAADPMHLDLIVSAAAASSLGATASTLRVYRDGVPVATCTDPVAAAPDPCVAATAPDPSGDARLSVRTTVGGTWTIGIPLNAAPVAVLDLAAGRPDTDVTIPVLANDTDPDGDPLTASLASAPAHGTASCAGSTCTYRSAAGYTGTDQFGYVADDGRGGTSSSTVTVTVTTDLAAAANLTNGGVVTTDPGTGPTAADPVQATVSVPVGGAGAVTLAVRPTATTSAGYGLLGQEVVISAPPAAEAVRPLVLSFQVDASLLPQGVTAQTLTLFRNGVAVPPCTGPGATPSPCIPTVLGRVDLPGGGVRIRVNTVAASTWSLGVASPTASAGGPYTVDEGSSVTLDASASSSPGGAPLGYTWTPSSVTPATAVRPTFTGVDDGTVPVQVRVSDGLTSSTASTTVTVRNVAPTLTPTVTAATLGTATRLTGTVVDPGTADTHAVTVDWGDGSRGPVALTGRALDVRHTYAAIGTYTVRVTVTDDDLGTSTLTRSTTVTWPFSWVGLQPSPTVNPVRTGALAVPFSLGGNRGLNVLAGPVTTIRVNCATGVTSGSAATLNGVLALARNTYSLVAVAPSSWSGTCRDLRLPLRDGTTQTVRFSFR